MSINWKTYRDARENVDRAVWKMFLSGPPWSAGLLAKMANYGRRLATMQEIAREERDREMCDAQLKSIIVRNFKGNAT